MGDEEKKTKREQWKDEFPESRYQGLHAEIDAACDKHGEDDVVVLETRCGVAIFRSPSGADYNRFTAGILNDKSDVKARAAEILARSCVVYPKKEIFAAWVERYSGIPSAVLKSLVKLAGAELVDRGKE